MTSRLETVTVDCRDPARLAAFWTRALGWEEVRGDEEGVEIAPPDRRGASILFLAVPDAKTVKNRLHFDLRAAEGGQAGEVARLEALGARKADIGQGPSVSWVVLADPEGNEFCVLRDT
ncbi:MAG: VOC family protein [Segniliparus sp.]|uniref:VOC family protein n=1 Tax=Segniliparus sp. TaxID=2804064 RepID=UPI003F2CCDB5